MRGLGIGSPRDAGVMARFTLDDVRAVCKARDAWWTVFLVDPLAIRLTRSVANRTPFTPNALTGLAFALGLASAGCFWQATRGWLAVGALLYHVGFVVDCVDGKLARLKGTGTPFGGWLDFMLDRVRDGVCALALTGGQYAATGEVRYLCLGIAIIALDMFRYVNGPQIAKARKAMQDRLTATDGDQEPQHGREQPGRSARPPSTPSSAYARLRRHLLAHRVRTHLVSGIEFQMAVFIIGPLTGAVLAVSAVAGALLLCFELALIVRFWLSHRSYAKTLARAI
jgi:phosphatidylglycerophosphate synthase